MMNKGKFRVLPMLLGFGMLAGLAPSAAQAQSRSQDIGVQMEREYGVLDRYSSEGSRFNDQLDRVVYRILRGVNQDRKREFQLKSAKILGGRSEKGDRMINAFALPDGRIYVTLGLLRAVQESPRADDELAFVVGHEVTHVTERHGQSQSNKAVQAGILAILLGAVTKSEAVGQVAGVGAAAYVSKYSRSDEYESDKGGLLAMHRAGYDLDAAISMLNRLRSKGEESNRLMNGWFGSHPLTGNRVDRIKEQIRKLRRGDLDLDGEVEPRELRQQRRQLRQQRESYGY